MSNEESKTYKIFISNLDEDDEEHDILLDKLSASPDFKWKDYAISDKSYPQELQEQIEPVDVVIILSGLYSKDEKRIQSQIDVALKLGKPIVLLRPYGMELVPSDLEKVATEVIGWNTFCIIDSIHTALGEDSEDYCDL